MVRERTNPQLLTKLSNIECHLPLAESWVLVQYTSVWNYLHYDCSSVKCMYYCEILPVHTRSSLFQTAADDASQDKTSIPTNRSCHLKTMYCNLALSPPDCRKMACVRGEELIFLAFLMKSLHQPVSNKTVKLWRLGTLFMDLIMHKLFMLLHDSCYYTVACIIAGFQAKSVIV